MIVAVILAAGLSRRMGEPKLLLPLEGRPVIRHTAERVLAGGVDALLVVVGTDRERLEAALVGLPARVVVNPDPAAGLAGSVRVGIAALPEGTEAALLALGDQPRLDARIVPALLAEARRSPRPIVAPRYRDGLGNPVLFRAAMFPELLALTGDRGARGVVERDPGRVALVALDLPMPRDLDTPADYERIRAPEEPV